jgi:ADP-ribose pyrophosphatase YjhB (NUDIX family)
MTQSSIQHTKPLITLRDEDIFPNSTNSFTTKYDHARVAVKAILLNEQGKIALVGTQNRLLLGGGVEAGESLAEAMKRECVEECGYDVEIIDEVGYAQEYRAQNKRPQKTICFVAKVSGGSGIPSSVQKDEQGMVAEWFTIDEAIQKIKEQIQTVSFLSYNTCFNLRVHLVFLEEYAKSRLVS